MVWKSVHCTSVATATVAIQIAAPLGEPKAHRRLLSTVGEPVGGRQVAEVYVSRSSLYLTGVPDSERGGVGKSFFPMKSLSCS